MIISYILISVLYVGFIAGSIYMGKKVKKYNYALNTQKEQYEKKISELTENVNQFANIKDQLEQIQELQKSQLPINTTITNIADELANVKDYIIKYYNINAKLNNFISTISLSKRELNDAINTKLPWYMDDKQDLIYKVSDVDKNIQRLKSGILTFLKDSNNIQNIDKLEELTTDTDLLIQEIEKDVNELIQRINNKNTQYDEDLNETIIPNDIVVDEANVQEQYKSLETITNEHKIDKDTLKQLVNDGLVTIK